VIVLAAAAALADVVPADQLDDVLEGIAATHQAPFLVGATWDTVKTCEGLVHDGLKAEVRRVPDDFGAATAFLDEQLDHGGFQCAVYVGKNPKGFSVYPLGGCDHPPIARPVAIAREPLPADPAKVGTLGISSVSTLPDFPTEAVEARARLAAELTDRKWPTGDKPRYTAAGTLESGSCPAGGEKPTCRVDVRWVVTDTARGLPVYEVVTRTQGVGPDNTAASYQALVGALDSLLSRPNLQGRLDPAPPTAADPPPTWTGELVYPACRTAPQRLPGESSVLAAATGTAAAGARKAALLVISPDGLALVPASVAAGNTAIQAIIGGQTVDATVLRTDGSLDLAAVKLAGDAWPCAPFGGATPSAGTKIYAPFGADGALVSGAVVGVQSVSAIQLLRSNLAFKASGAPILDPAGTVRAVTSVRVAIGDLSGAAIGIPAGVVLDRLDLRPDDSPDAKSNGTTGTRGIVVDPPTLDEPDPPWPG
jgi:hypothetical protein